MERPKLEWDKGMIEGSVELAEARVDDIACLIKAAFASVKIDVEVDAHRTYDSWEVSVLGKKVGVKVRLAVSALATLSNDVYPRFKADVMRNIWLLWLQENCSEFKALGARG